MSITGLELELVGKDGNAYAIMGECSKVLKKAGLYDEFWSDYYAEATSGDYEHLLATTMDYFDVF